MWTRKMVKHWEKVMYGIEKFIGFPEMNFGRTFVVSFQLLLLVLGVDAVGEGRGYKNKGK